ncbi:NAD(P)-dependent oxidoreductase [Halorubrum sp. DTA46]|uniref:NAD(P)-dependent oxidoreductase n=1 Tax=Halorubrum sp. DTA46 TaxID=3402162 RepID=UPI003AAD1D7A
MTVGFVGLGRMGLPMARNLVEDGFDVVGADLDDERKRALADAGGGTADSIADAVADADVAITVLRTPEQVLGVAEALLPAMDEGGLWVDMSSIDPLTSESVAELAAEKGIRTVDAPVSGGVSGAEAGTLSVIVGGDEGDVDEARALFEPMAETVFHVGSIGAGQTVKLANQLLVGAQTALVAEAFRFGDANGIDRGTLRDVLVESAGSSWVLETWGDRYIEEDYEPGFEINLQHKDLRLMIEAAIELDVPVPIGAAAMQKYVEAKRDGLADRDVTAVFQL